MDIKIPPLRERPDDIPDLVNSFIKTISPKLGKDIKGIEDSAMNLLLNYEWPGNVRELNNVIERAINMAPGPLLTISLFPPQMRELSASEKALSYKKTSLEEQTIRDCLQKNKYNRNKTAAELGISRVTLYRKMIKYSLM